MSLKNAILGLRKLGIGRSLSASQIVNEIDKYLFTGTDWTGYLLFDEDGDSEFLPLLPENHPDQFYEYQDEYFNEIEDLYPKLEFWCRGFEFNEDEDRDEERELTQFDAIKSFLLVSEVIKCLLTPEDRDAEEYVLNARSAASNISPDFWVASAFFNRALDNRNDTGTLLLENWVKEDTYKFSDEDCNELTKSFCELAIWLSSYSESFCIPSEIPSWKESGDFLKVLEILDRPVWSGWEFRTREIYEIRFTKYIQDDIVSWLRIFNHYYLPSKWAYYFWESPLDASVWADSGFKPIEAALWDSIGYDTFDALVANENEWVYATIAPMVRVGMTITDENVELWGNATSSAEIIDAIDRGFPNVLEYKKYSTVEADYVTIQKFLEKNKAQLSNQEISRAIQLERNGMDIGEAITWSKIDLNSSLVKEFKLANQTPLQAKKWIESGFPLDLALKWMSVGIYLEEAIAWSKIDRDLSAVLRFKSFELTPLQAAQWNGCGFQLDIAIKWVSLGLDIHNALLWLEQEIDHEVASWFLERKIDNPRKAKLWLKYIPKKEIQKWHDAGFEPFLAYDWREIGFGPEASLEWLNQGVETAKEASKWNEGFFYHRDALKEAAEWISRSISHENAQKWKAKGITPEIAERREQAGIKP